MDRILEQVQISNLRFWSPAGTVARFTILDANQQPIESFEKNFRGNTPQSLATIKGTALVAGGQSVYADSDAQLLVASTLGGVEPTIASAIIQPGNPLLVGLYSPDLYAFSTKANSTIYALWTGTQPTAGTLVQNVVNANGVAIGTTGNITWNANANTWATNWQTALNAVVAGWTVFNASISGRAIFAITAPTGYSLQLGTLNLGSLTNGATGLLGIPLSSMPSRIKDGVLKGGGSNGDMYIYGSSMAASGLILEEQVAVLTTDRLNNFCAFGIDGLFVARLASVNGPNLSGLVEVLNA